MSSVLTAANFATPQSDKNQPPTTITAAATVAPSNLVSFIAGTTAIATITPPVVGAHILVLIATSTNWAGCVTTGNILVASVTNSALWANKANIFAYDPLTAKYYPSYAVHSTTT